MTVPFRDSTGRLDRGTCIKAANMAILFALAIFFLAMPPVLLLRDLSDASLRRPEGLPRVAWRMHRALAPRYERWALARVASGRAAHLALHDVPSTEWPMFGSVFFLAATESLQDEWDRADYERRGPAPRAYARGAIDASVALLLDPVHHTWVQTHWGTNYLHRENVFFRSMLIQGLTSRERLLRDGRHVSLLWSLVNDLADDLDRSPHGLLNDYPGECYPIDVFAAVASIRDADSVLGTDHTAFAERARRAFTGRQSDKRGLVPYLADPATGIPLDTSRGIGNSYVLIYAPALYPDLAQEWYDRYVRDFWQNRWLASGFREYPRDMPHKDWLNDPDSGPVIAGFSPSGNAYGVAAARVNGRFDHAWTLSAQVLTASWPLPGECRLGARLLSNAFHAPYLGEANLLFLLTRRPAAGVPIRTGGGIAGIVAVGFVFFIGGFALVMAAIRSNWRAWRRTRAHVRLPIERVQTVVWILLVVGGLSAWVAGSGLYGVLLLLIGQFLPRVRRCTGIRPADTPQRIERTRE